MRPLEDVRILAIEQYGAGPFGTLHLADMGADIIKIEDPRANGDVGRYVPPFQEGEDSLFFETFNRNKRSLSLDITTSGGRRVFEDLVRMSDAVYARCSCTSSYVVPRWSIENIVRCNRLSGS